MVGLSENYPTISVHIPVEDNTITNRMKRQSICAVSPIHQSASKLLQHDIFGFVSNY